MGLFMGNISSNVQSKQSFIFGMLILSALACMPLIGMIAPRFLAFGPGLIGLIGIFAYRPVCGTWPPMNKTILYLLGMIIAMIGVSIIWAINTEISVDRLSRTALLLTGVVLLYSFLWALDANVFTGFNRIFPPIVILSGMIVSIDLYSNGALYKFLNADINSYTVEHFNLAQMNRSVIIFELSAIAAFFMLASNIKQSWLSRIYALGLVAVLMVVLWGTESQSAQFAIGIATLAALAFPVMRYKCAWRLLQGVLVLLLFATPWLTQWAFHYIAAIASESDWLSQGYAANRMEIWDYVSRRALEKPWLGHGVEATQSIKDFETALIYTPTNLVLHPHNFAVQLWIEFGVMGALVGGVFLTTIVEKIRIQTPYLSHMFFVLFFATLSIASMSYGMWQGWWIGLLSFLLALCVIIKKSWEQGD